MAITSLRAELCEDQAGWDRALLSLPSPHVLQSWLWGATKAQTGWRAQRWLWYAGEQASGGKSASGRPVAAAAMLVRQLAPLPGAPAVAYVPKGPLLEWDEPGLGEAVLVRLEVAARQAGALFLKIDPDVPLHSPSGQALSRRLAERGWRPSPEQIQFRNTVVSDLTGDEQTLLGRMKPKWRYNIRLADRRGVVVRDGSAADLRAFYNMYVETGQRDGFLVRPYEYYQLVWEQFIAAGLGHLLLAEVSGTPVAGLILFRFGATAWYFYGASTARARALMPNHALQWAALRWAKDHGCTRYDWWGAPDVLDETDSMWGVYRFKEGFGGDFVAGIGAYDFVVSPVLYWLYTTAMPRILEVARRRHRVQAPASSGRAAAEGGASGAGDP